MDVLYMAAGSQLHQRPTSRPLLNTAINVNNPPLWSTLDTNMEKSFRKAIIRFPFIFIYHIKGLTYRTVNVINSNSNGIPFHEWLQAVFLSSLLRWSNPGVSGNVRKYWLRDRNRRRRRFCVQSSNGDTDLPNHLQVKL